VTEKNFTYQDSTIYYRTIGTGKPVVLIHGFAEDGDIWYYQADFLKDQFKLIIPDLPGSGRSQLVKNADIDTYAEIIKVILDNECLETPLHCIGEITMIGHSLGGYITLAFAEEYPQYLDSFGLFHSSAFADREEKKAIRTKAIDFINDNGPHAFLKTSIPGLFTQTYADENPESINELIEKGKNFSAAALVQYYQAMIARPDRTAVLKSFPKPILFIMGEYDNAIPLQSSLQQCYLPIQSNVSLLDQSAHMGMWEEMEKSNQILHQFLMYAKSNPL